MIVRAHHQRTAEAAPYAWHVNSLHTLLRAVETLFSLWLEFMRQHLSHCGSAARAPPLCRSMCACRPARAWRGVLRRRPSGLRKTHGAGRRRTPLPQGVRAIPTRSTTSAVLQATTAHRPRDGSPEAVCRRASRRPIIRFWTGGPWPAYPHRLSSTISMMDVLLIGSFLVARRPVADRRRHHITGFATLLIARLDPGFHFRRPDLGGSRQARRFLWHGSFSV